MYYVYCYYIYVCVCVCVRYYRIRTLRHTATEEPYFKVHLGIDECTGADSISLKNRTDRPV